MKTDNSSTIIYAPAELQPARPGPAINRLAKARSLHMGMPRSIDGLSLLQTISVFKRLSLLQLAVLAADLGSQMFGRGQTIFHQGDRADTLYLLARGQVRIYQPHMWGHELSMAIFRAG